MILEKKCTFHIRTSEKKDIFTENWDVLIYWNFLKNFLSFQRKILILQKMKCPGNVRDEMSGG